jgi:hypothetical protein
VITLGTPPLYAGAKAQCASQIACATRDASREALSDHHLLRSRRAAAPATLREQPQHRRRFEARVGCTGKLLG